MARKVSWVLFLFLAMGLVGCDHATKLAAQQHLAGSAPMQLVPGWVDLRYAENRDTAFSLTAGWGSEYKTLVLGMVSAAIIAGLLAFWWHRRRGPAVEHLAYALVLSGALGNVLDRLIRGYVVDFVHFRYWPVFNVADVAVVAGVGLLMISMLRERRPPAAARPSS